MKTRRIGDFNVGEVGLGCMNLSHAYGVPPSPELGKKLLLEAFDLGITHFDSAALYGFGRNEELVGPTLKPIRDQIMLASKCGMQGVDGMRVIDGRPETMRKTLEDSLRRLQTEVIDLYYLHRWDKKVPIEDSIGELSRMVEEGKVCAIGLSEVSANTLRKAHAVHPIAAVQTEYSLWTRNAEIEVLDACEELGAAFVAFSPLARGFLTDTDLDPANFAEKDIRRNMPRFQEPHFSNNAELLTEYRALAKEAGCTGAQLALGWLLAKRPYIHVIPGTTSLAHLRDDVAASEVELSQDIIERLEKLINRETISGPRYPAPTQAEIDTEEFAA
ncbi:aldo/keto reductase [Emcibacter nanhaiensis]|uniref:Aldo/keto reductase n=1 Tax=Emcibacter nanhaiensis TaxID=1505037 RepID=A0A501PG08_9PROT|nr:aldo/keto reductase [Emcibacter nanhaiensis]TPD59068.1 aldo/keto reductase [Emcibacter nanhaiensis]